MPIYFGPVAPYCPVSRDQPPGLTSPLPIRQTTIPPAFDLASAIKAVNIARNIVLQLAFNYVINNVHTPSTPSTSNQLRRSHWVENTSARVKRRYKYYGTNADGSKDPDTWVMTERIERMKWSDSAWKTSLTFSYGDKGEGEPVPPSGGP
jgi:hypothetical protein